MTKSILSAFFCIGIVLSALIFLPSPASAATEGYYTYEIRNNEAIITDVDYSISGNIIIPDTLGGYPVTEIDGYAFQACDDITGVELGKYITKLNNGAFYNIYNLNYVIFPDCLTYIGEFAFTGCIKITSVHFSDQLSYIGPAAFNGCHSLTGLWVDEENPFYSNDAYGALFNKDKTTLVQLPCGFSGIYTIPDSVVTIDSYALSDVRDLISVNIPESVTTLGDFAFAYCDSLTHVTLPDSVTSAGAYLFPNCPKLAYVDFGEGVTEIKKQSLSTCPNLNSVVIGKSTTSIEYATFVYCKKLATVFYTGTQEQWDAITIGGSNNDLLNAQLILNYVPHICTEFGEWIVTTAPTFTSEGERYLVCSKCGNVVTEVIDVAECKIAYWNIAIEDDFKIKFYIKISEYIVDTADVEFRINEHSVFCKISDLEKNDDGYYILTAGIAASQMSEIITVIIWDFDECGYAEEFTVKQYCNTILADESYSQYHTLVKEMLNYGAMAQIYFDCDSDNLVNEGITDVSAVEVPETAKAIQIIDSLNNVDFYGASLVYRDRIAVRYYFTGDISGLTFTANGTSYTPIAKNEMYYIEVANILPQNLDQQITLTVKDTTGNTLSVTYGPMNYIVRMYQSGDEKTQNLLKALYNYHLAAKALV